MLTGVIVVRQESMLVWTEKGVQCNLAEKYEPVDPKPEVGRPVEMLIFSQDLARSFFWSKFSSWVKIVS